MRMNNESHGARSYSYDASLTDCSFSTIKNFQVCVDSAVEVLVF